MRIRRSVLAMLVALALGPAWVTGLLAPLPVQATDTLPACQYDDVATPFASPADWQHTLVDTIYAVGKDYVPPDLVPVTDAGISGNGEVRSLVIGDLRAMAAAAKAAGAPIAVQSAYRSYATQVYTFNYWTQTYGHSAALLGSARPGHSEHQLGVAVDFRSAGTSAEWTSDWATTAAGAWMAQNAWRYGFVMSYPRATSPDITCYRYEPWHYRYVGPGEAAAIHDAGITLREFLWYRAGNDGSPTDGSPAMPPAATGVAAPTGTATATRAPDSTATPSAEPSTRPSPGVAGAASPPGSSPETAIRGAQGAPGSTDTRRSGTPLDLLLSALGIMLGIVVGLGILVGVERLDRALRELLRGLSLA